jgi:hypothetical protein
MTYAFQCYYCDTPIIYDGPIDDGELHDICEDCFKWEMLTYLQTGNEV